MGELTGEHKGFEANPFLHGMPSIVAASHELKSPLSLVRQLSLLLESGDLSEGETQRILRQITLTSERALRLTADLTKASRLEDALFTLEPINPKQLCEEIVHELRPLFEAHGQTISLAPRTHPLLLVANRDLLRRIIVNFSDNALHYAEGSREIQLHINTFNDGQTIRLGVRDYGPALSSDMWRSLRPKLSTAPQPIHARPQSSGLGLYIASQFAEAMNGSIGVTRHRDGATFFVDLQASRQLSLV